MMVCGLWDPNVLDAGEDGLGKSAHSLQKVLLFPGVILIILVLMHLSMATSLRPMSNQFHRDEIV